MQGEARLLGPSFYVVHLANILGPIVLIDHGGHELFLVVCSSPDILARAHSCVSRDLLVIHDCIDVGDNPVFRSGINRLFQFLLGTPLGTLGAFLLKLSKIPDVVAVVSTRLPRLGSSSHVITSSFTAGSVKLDVMYYE